MIAKHQLVAIIRHLIDLGFVLEISYIGVKTFFKMAPDLIRDVVIHDQLTIAKAYELLMGKPHNENMY